MHLIGLHKVGISLAHACNISGVVHTRGRLIPQYVCTLTVVKLLLQPQDSFPTLDLEQPWVVI